MNTKEILEQALALEPEERSRLVEGILKSLEEHEKMIDEIWTEEAVRRLKAHREGRLEGIPMEEVFKEN